MLPGYYSCWGRQRSAFNHSRSLRWSWKRKENIHWWIFFVNKFFFFYKNLPDLMWPQANDFCLLSFFSVMLQYHLRDANKPMYDINTITYPRCMLIQMVRGLSELQSIYVYSCHFLKLSTCKHGTPMTRHASSASIYLHCLSATVHNRAKRFTSLGELSA